MQKAFDNGAAGDNKLTGAQKTQLEQIANQLGGLVFDPATTSLGVEVVDSSPVLYIVQHWSKQIDAPREWARLMQEANAIVGDKKDDLTIETYAEDSLAATRITLKSDQTIRIDLAQKDNDVFIAIAPTDEKYLHALLAARGEGPMKGVLSGWVDLAKSAEAAEKFPGSPLAALPVESQKKLANLLQDQKITIGTSADGDAATIDVTVTKGFLENLPKLIEALSPAGAPDVK
jgi:hypothetical protein